MAPTKNVESSTKSETRHGMRMADIECPTVYSNFMGVGATPFDLAIIFGEVDISDSHDAEANPKVKVILAPEQAANLIKMVKDVLDQYVQANGPLRNKAIANTSPNKN
jgi:hypothetical protein